LRLRSFASLREKIPTLREMPSGEITIGERDNLPILKEII